MTKLKEETQFGEPVHVFRCYCGEFAFLTVTQDAEDKEFYVSITYQADSLSDRLKLAYKALRGMKVSGSNHIMLAEESAKELRKAFTLEKHKTQ